jgi:hypothetical protein
MDVIQVVQAFSGGSVVIDIGKTNVLKLEEMILSPTAFPRNLLK